MQNKPVALVTGANQGIGLQIAKDLAAQLFIVLVGSRNLECGEAAAREVGSDAHAIQLDVTDQNSINTRMAELFNAMVGAYETWAEPLSARVSTGRFQKDHRESWKWGNKRRARVFCL